SDHSVPGWWIQAASGNALYLFLNAGATYQADECGGVWGFTSGTLRHVVITYDGTSDYTGMVCYVNGSPFAAGNAANTLASTISNTGNAYMGRESRGSDWLNGSLDQLIMWDKVLTANNIADMYNSAAGNVYTP
ncbi:unnamed protein product, partial [marine sediment metagenome]